MCSRGFPTGTLVGSSRVQSHKTSDLFRRPNLGFSSGFFPAGISFTPKEVGEHVVSVKKNGKHVTNSPFRIMVGQSEIGDASKVKVFGQGLTEGHTCEVAEFIVDTRNAGEQQSSSPPPGLRSFTSITSKVLATRTPDLRDSSKVLVFTTRDG